MFIIYLTCWCDLVTQQKNNEGWYSHRRQFQDFSAYSSVAFIAENIQFINIILILKNHLKNYDLSKSK